MYIFFEKEILFSSDVTPASFIYLPVLSKKHTNVERGGSRDPGVRRPGAGRGQLPARSKIFRAILSRDDEVVKCCNSSSVISEMIWM